MVGIIQKVSGLFDFWAGHRNMMESISKLEADRKVYDDRIRKLTKAAMDGEDQWFLDLVKRDPSCAMKIIEECEKKDA